MKAKSILICLGLLLFFSFSAQVNCQSNIKEEEVTYTSDGISLRGFLACDGNPGKRPAILVVHEWWGLNDYAKMRVRELAQMGYIAMAVDMFGNGKTAANPQEAQNLTAPFYKDPQLAKKRLDAALEKIKTYPQTDAGNVVAIGYCFGGSVVLNAAKLGADLKGVVSFHGSLAGVPPSKKLKAKILVCHGASDKFTSPHEVDVFKHQLDSIGANYTFKVYANAMHAFTNPDATKLGKEFNLPIAYNAEADKNSWNDMKAFFKKLFKS
jgi:dienelactone hydrolase